MKHSRFVGLGFLVAAILIGCGGGGEDAVVKEQISIMNEMSSILEGVTDANSMQAAKPKIDALKKRGDEVVAKTKNWTPEKTKALAERYQAEMKAATERMFKATIAAGMKSMPGGGQLKIPGLP